MAGTYVKKSARQFEKYGLIWPDPSDPIAIEQHMVQRGGRWRNKKGEMVGNGLLFHFMEFQKLLWGKQKIWHKWNTLQTECYLNFRTIGVIGPASSGKTNSAGTDVLSDYYCFSDCTTVLCCSTTRDRLEDRVWGEIKKYHRMAINERSWIPGHLIEGKQRIITDDRSLSVEGRDFRNGLMGVPCKKGNDYVGLGDFAGIKNKRVRLIADELSLLPRIFVDAISNLDKNPDFKAVGLGNPKDTTDALGVLCEPSAQVGGWDSGIDQTPGTKTWPTRRPQGVCIQLPGSDSPNLDGSLGIPLITQEQINRDIEFYGKDSLWFSMMDEGRMPRGQGSRRVLTRNMCITHRAMEEALWRDGKRIKIAFMDAAYKGVGGDRCIYGELEFGPEADAEGEVSAIVTSVVSQKPISYSNRMIISLKEMVAVPINASNKEEAEDQIAEFVKNRCTSSGIPPENFFFDSGMRTGLVTALARLWSPYVNSIDCGGKPSEKPVSEQITSLCKDYYSKYITELWFSVRLTVEASQFRGMSEEVIGEFSQREWKVVGANKIEVETKVEMKLKTGRSPDLADALAIGLEGAKRRGFVINRLARSRPEDRKGTPWARELKQKVDATRKQHQLNYTA